jgi:hypothetical protein
MHRLQGAFRQLCSTQTAARARGGSRSIRLTLQAEGEAALQPSTRRPPNPPVRADKAQLRLHIEQSAIKMRQRGRVVGSQHDRTHHPHLIYQ